MSTSSPDIADAVVVIFGVAVFPSASYESFRAFSGVALNDVAPARAPGL